jgi:hypothetical protein
MHTHLLGNRTIWRPLLRQLVHRIVATAETLLWSSGGLDLHFRRCGVHVRNRGYPCGHDANTKARNSSQATHISLAPLIWDSSDDQTVALFRPSCRQTRGASVSLRVVTERVLRCRICGLTGRARAAQRGPSRIKVGQWSRRFSVPKSSRRSHSMAYATPGPRTRLIICRACSVSGELFKQQHGLVADRRAMCCPRSPLGAGCQDLRVRAKSAACVSLKASCSGVMAPRNNSYTSQSR